MWKDTVLVEQLYEHFFPLRHDTRERRARLYRRRYADLVMKVDAAIPVNNASDGRDATGVDGTWGGVSADIEWPQCLLNFAVGLDIG